MRWLKLTQAQPADLFKSRRFHTYLLVVFLLVTACEAPDENGGEGDSLDIEEIIRSAAAAPDPGVRAEVARLIALARTESLYPLLEGAVTDSNPLVRAAALQALLELKLEGATTPIMSAIRGRDEVLHEQALDLAMQFGSEELRVLVVEAALSHPNSEFRRRAFHRLKQDPAALPVAAYPAFEEAMASDDPEVLGALLTLLEGEQKVAVEFRLHGYLTHEDPELRESALRVLSRHGSTDSWLVLRWLHANSEEYERELAGLALARLGDHSVYADVSDVVLRGREDYVPLALQSLGGLVSEESLSLLIAHRSSTRVDVREAVINALMEFPNSESYLFGFLNDRNGNISMRAAVALRSDSAEDVIGRVCGELRLVDDPMPLLTLAWRLVQNTANRPLLATCASLVERLITDNDPEVRSLAASVYFLIQDATLGDFAAEEGQATEVIYAYLNSTLELEDTSHLRTFYAALLDHELIVVRTAAALGLLRSTP